MITVFSVGLLTTLAGSGLVLYLFHPLLRRSRPVAADELPQVTVILAARNEEDELPLTLAALDQLNYPRNKYSLVLVDDGSTDNTARLLQEFTDNREHCLWLQSAPHPGLRGKVNALMTAIEKSDSEWLLFTDADCRVPRDWLHQFALEMTRSDVVCGHVRAEEPRSFCQRLEQLEFLISTLQVWTGTVKQRPPFSRGGNWAYRRSLFTRVNGFAGLPGSGWGDDIYLLQKFRRQQDVRYGFAGNATVSTTGATNCHSFAQNGLRKYGKIGDLGPSQIIRHLLQGLLLLLLPLSLVCYRPLLVGAIVPSVVLAILLRRVSLRLQDPPTNLIRMLLLLWVFPLYVLGNGIRAQYHWLKQLRQKRT